jgi:uncharacterized protein YndB with AHSA1/START domain
MSDQISTFMAAANTVNRPDVPQALYDPPVELVVRKSARCLAPLATVFEALVSETDMREWMSAVVDIDARLGGELIVQAEAQSVTHGTIVTFEPPTRLVVEWRSEDWPGPLTTAMELSEGGGTVFVALEEHGFDGDDDLCRVRDYLWSHWLIRLRAVVAHR